jgi:hypothetical protein
MRQNIEALCFEYLIFNDLTFANVAFGCIEASVIAGASL